MESSYKIRGNHVGPIAQSVEQRTFNPWVDGSSPSGPTADASSSPPATGIGVGFAGVQTLSNRYRRTH